MLAVVSTFPKHKVGDKAALSFSSCVASPDEAYSAYCRHVNFWRELRSASPSTMHPDLPISKVSIYSTFLVLRWTHCTSLDLLMYSITDLQQHWRPINQEKINYTPSSGVLSLSLLLICHISYFAFSQSYLY